MPPEVSRSLAISGGDLENEIKTMADTATDLLAKAVYARLALKPKLFINNLSRLVIDPERFPDEREEMNAVGMGAVYTRTSDKKILREEDLNRDRKLIKEFFDPYSEALEKCVTHNLEEFGKCLLIDLHSFGAKVLPYELHQDDARPNICYGTDEFHTSSELLEAAKSSFPNKWSSSINEPFAGTYVPLKYYGLNSHVQSIMLEIRKDTYANGDTTSPLFSECVEAISLFIEQVSDKD